MPLSSEVRELATALRDPNVQATDSPHLRRPGARAPAFASGSASTSASMPGDPSHHNAYLEAVQKVIAFMTLGMDVSGLAMDMIKASAK